MKKLDDRIGKILFKEKQINKAAVKAAKWIDENYRDKNPLLVGILKGSIPFFAKVLSKVTIDVEIDFVCYSSYGGNVNKMDKAKLLLDLKEDIKGRDIIVIDDICDTGKTLLFFKQLFEKRNPNSLKFMVMGDKKEGRTESFTPDYICFNVPNIWVVGFGFNYHGNLRNLPYIATLNPDLYKKEKIE